MTKDDNSTIDKVIEEFPDAEIKKDLAVIEGEFIEIQPFNLDNMKEIYRRMKAFVRAEMHKDIDFGVIPGVAKKSLYKPGAEKLQRFFGLFTHTELIEKIEQWDQPITEKSFPLFHYRYVTKVYNRHQIQVASCEGECNSYEGKYRWRWVPESRVPKDFDIELLEQREALESEFVFAVEGKKTTGQYGKPAEYWQSWEEDIKSGEARSITRKAKSGKEYDAWERGGVQYRIPNLDIHSQVNTIIKMSQKRSYVGGVKIAANASEYFTEDVEDAVENEPNPARGIRLVVPTKKHAGNELIRYAEALGVPEGEGGLWIKNLLKDNNVAYSLDEWESIVELVEKSATLSTRGEK